MGNTLGRTVASPAITDHLPNHQDIELDRVLRVPETVTKADTKTVSTTEDTQVIIVTVKRAFDDCPYHLLDELTDDFSHHNLEVVDLEILWR